MMGRGVSGYLKGTVVKPDPSNTAAATTGCTSVATTTTPTTPGPDGTTSVSQAMSYTQEPSTLITSSRSYIEEYVQRTALFIFHSINSCKDIHSLEVKLDRSAKELWDLVIANYGTASLKGRINAKAAYEAISLKSSEGDVEQYTKEKKMAWASFVAQGGKVDLDDFLADLVARLGIEYS